MFVLDRLLVGGLGFVLDKVAQVVDQQLDDDETLRDRLLEGQMRRELGEIDEEEFAALEADTLRRLREIQERRRGGPTQPISTGEVADVEVTFDEGSR
jgi:hypothetical protein